MCTVSVIYDMYRELPDSWYTPQRIETFRSLVESAKQYDSLTNQPDCEDPEKAKVKEHIDELEISMNEYKGMDYE